MKCPNCGFEQPDGSNECQMCQIVFSKFRTRQERQFSPVSATPSPRMPPRSGHGEPFARQGAKPQAEKEQHAKKTANIFGWILAFGFWFVWRAVAPDASWWTGLLLCVAVIAIGETLCRFIILSR
jgi:hypothetical protein